jgi:hypothetical protein
MTVTKPKATESKPKPQDNQLHQLDLEALSSQARRVPLIIAL